MGRLKFNVEEGKVRKEIICCLDQFQGHGRHGNSLFPVVEDSTSALTPLIDWPMIYVIIVRTSVTNEDVVKEAKKKLIADSRISMSMLNKMASVIRDHENLPKYSACVAFKRTIADIAIKLKALMVTMIRRAMPRNFPNMYWEREIGLDKTV